MPGAWQVLHMVNHTTVGKDSVLFEAIVQLSLPGLDKLNRASILDPIVGICCNLGDISTSCSRGKDLLCCRSAKCSGCSRCRPQALLGAETALI